MSTKILSGTFRGRKIITPKIGVRPSKAIVRKALMDQVRFQLSNKTFLDLFAGSGAMGIEAISNGAARAVFVEKEKYSIHAIQDNIQKFLLQNETELIINDVLKAISFFYQKQTFFDFIFADPPYDSDLAEAVVESIDKQNILKPDGYFFLETNKSINVATKQIQCMERRKYGKSYLCLYQNQALK